MSAVIRLAAAVVRGVCDEDGPKAEVMRELALDARREHDAAIAERDRLRAQLELVTAENHARALRETQSLEDWSALRAERDRLRRELEALLDQMRGWCSGSHEAATTRSAIYGPTIDRLDAILRGES